MPNNQQQNSELPLNPIASQEARARQANSLKELCFSMVNDSYNLLPSRQALVFVGTGKDAKLQTISGLAKLAEDSPYSTWLKRIWPVLEKAFDGKPAWVTQTNIATTHTELLQGWEEWWPEGVYALPVTRRDGVILGWQLFLLDQPPTEIQHKLLMQLLATWSYSWEMLASKAKHSLITHWKHLPRWKKYVITLLIGVIPFIPIRQSLLAPAEIIALDAMMVTSPMDGVIKEIYVQPNQAVKAEQKLYALDDTVLRNRLAVLTQAVAVADAELQSRTQLAFDDPRSKAEVALLSGKAKEKRAELASVQEQLNRIYGYAEHDGIVVFSDKDDWLGRPVSTGERIMQLANPAQPGVLIHVPVSDALVLHEGAQVKLFLTVKPLSPLHAEVFESSYHVSMSAENIASYRLKARFLQDEKLARIGLRGTAKVYGDWTFLGYYLLRRPIARVREWTGW